ncbi:MAG: NAD(P)-dependent oxidoreductase [Methanobacteriota archaeon]|nr:MAG: NAD(P)-dependent oxidoreductase [Euryarchaeota archaeon]
MKLFIAGGTGVIGKRLVPRLVENGHQVGVLARSEENIKIIRQMGAIPKKGSLFDTESLNQATKDVDVVLHLATSIPRKNKTSPKDWEMNSRLRIEGAMKLMDAASKNEVAHYIQQSVTFAYGHRIEPINDTIQPELPVPTKVKLPRKWQEVIDNPVHMENQIATKAEQVSLDYTILRFGWFYSHDSANIQDIHAGNFAHIWGENPFWSMIHVDDAVAAIHATIEKKDKTVNQAFNVVDNQPVQSREFLEYTRQQFGKSPLKKVPGLLVRLLFGPYSLNFLTSSLQVSNRRFKQVMDWKPMFPTFKEGVEEAVDKFLKLNA